MVVRGSTALFVQLLTCVCLGLHGPTEARPLKLDDILRLESVGEVEVSRDGTKVVFERIPAMVDRRDFGIDEPRLAGDIYVYQLASGRPPEPILDREGVAGRWMGSLSPSGDRLALYWRDGEATRAGVFDLLRKRLTVFEFTPLFDFSQTKPLWISDGEVIYATLTGEQQPPRTAFRRHAARKLAAAWEDAWSGLRSTADVISSQPARDHRSARGRLVRADARTGRFQAIADGVFSQLTLSPDKKHVVAVARGEIRGPEGHPVPTNGQGPYRFDVVLIDTAGSAPPKVLCSDCVVGTGSFEWSHSGEALAFFALRRGSDWARGTYWLYTKHSGELVEIPHRGLDLVSQRERGLQANPEQAVPFPDGIVVPARRQQNPNARPLFSDRPFGASNLGRVDWYFIDRIGTSRCLTADFDSVSPVAIAADESGVILQGDGGVWHVSLDGSRRKLFMEADGPVSYVRQNDPEGFERRDLSANVVMVQQSAGNKASLVVIDLRTRQAKKIPLPSGIFGLAAVSQRGELAVYKRAGGSGWALEAASANGRRVQLWAFNRHLSGITQAKEVTIRYTMPTGTEGESCAMLPAGWQPGTRLPVVVHVYPMSPSRCLRYYTKGLVNQYEPELFASMGFIVLFPDAPVHLLRDAANPLAHWSRIVLPAVDALVDEGYADKERVGVFGFSYGSISALALIAQTNRFKAAVAAHGAADFISHYGALGVVRRLWPDDLLSIGQALTYEVQGSYLWLGGAPWSTPQSYLDASPLLAVEKIQTPLMLMHSDLDWNYQMHQFDELFTAMLRLGKPVDYVRYWGEGHGVTSPANIRDMWSRLEEFYSAHLSSPGRMSLEQGGPESR